ncbi:MAG: neutral/alkaline non-lysosomal ceramidase N-terminal domain-containing protein [Clostridia bacterium]|nr:neutral/alkaline non-lysosomal ceramidase N-terminal domain-containing protein [Clostridia bacterium]
MNKLLFGVGREIITPEVGCTLMGYRPDLYSTCVEDDLTATAFYFEQDGKKALAISATVACICTELSEEILSEIKARFGIPKTDCILAAIHTHSGPKTQGLEGWGDVDREYCDSIFIPKILSAVETAINNPKPVKMGVSVGKSLVGINRRELTHTRNRVNLGQNPWGCFNPDMTVISFKDNDDNIVANIIHYAAHCTAAGANTEITRDWAGLMIDALEEKSGAITAFFNGCAGDVGPRLSNGKTTGDLTYVKELGKIAGDDAVRIFNTISEYEDIDFSVLSKDINIPLKARIPYETAVEELKKYEGNVINIDALKKNHFERVKLSYENNERDEEFLTVRQTLIKIGDVVLLSSPFELFSEIGMRISKGCDVKHVLSLSYANGNEGYFVTEDQLVREGYEVNCYRFWHKQSPVDDGDLHFIQASVANINELIKKYETE